MNGARRWLAAPLLGTALAIAAWRRGALSRSGALGAAAVGTAVFGAAGLRGSALLLCFFGSSTALSRLSGRDNAAAETGPRRTLAQVLANGGLPAALALCNACRPSSRLRAAYAGALAAAIADTWATEIGALSTATPRLITSGRHVPRGVSGGVTPLGTAASLAGALALGSLYAALERRPALAWQLGLAGFSGALADSVLGASLQAAYTCRTCGAYTEDRAHAHGGSAPTLTRLRGLPLMTNDAVNLCASLSGALVGAWLSNNSHRGKEKAGVRGQRPEESFLSPNPESPSG